MAPHSPDSVEKILVDRLKNGDKTAFSELYDNYSAALYGVIRRVITDEEQARDVLQEVFVKIWRGIGLYDPGKSRLFTWLLNIARNAAIDLTRSRQYKTGIQNRNIEDNVNKINRRIRVDNDIDHIGLKEVVEKLRPEDRMVIDLMYFGGYTQEEISKEFNIPLGTVKTRARAAIMKLRELMGEAIR